jgi:CRP/FNR family transcriptional regulator, anaerobic regulatory protein
MIDKTQLARTQLALPLLQRAETDLVREFQQAAFFARFPAGRDVFVEGDRVDAIALLISGVVRVYKMGETGRQITLYRFGDGQSCILTANAILSRKSFPAVATVEKDAEAAMVPADVFRDWVRRYTPWRDFVFDLLSARLASVMEIVEEVAFRRMDSRLADFLAVRARGGNPIPITHQAIASELGTSREVISRLLEDLAEQGLIRMSRGQIEMLKNEG